MPGTGGDRATKGVLDGAAIKCGIDPSLGDGTGGTRRVIVGEGGPTSYDVWLDRHTDEGRLRRRTD